MKYFSKLAALLLGAAMIFAFAGCANSTDSTDSTGSDGSENVVYTVKNGKNSEMTISYKNKSGEWTNEQTIPGNGTYEIPANDAKSDIKTFNLFGVSSIDSPVIYLKITVGDTTVEGYIQAVLEKVTGILGVERTESGWLYHVYYIEN